ncbi:MAG: hypothetical protein LBV68_08450 [Spirochaetaceae bacterium]|nr:hypothetical protein [Spirochaetaceae bacterium]
MRKSSKLFSIPLGIAVMLAAAAAFGAITMLLWNVFLPALLGLPRLNWLQATGLLVLCRILFGFADIFGSKERDKRRNLSRRPS